MRATKDPCDACHAIYEVVLTLDILNKAEKTAREWINRTEFTRSAAAGDK